MMGSAAYHDPAVRMLLTERDELLPLLRRTTSHDFDRPTVCAGWSVRDVLGHCGAALHRLATDDLHGFGPDDNELDVVERRTWKLGDVVDELEGNYAAAGAAIAATEGELDVIALGEWMHGGDVRDALGLPFAYKSSGSAEALEVLIASERVARTPRVHVTLPDRAFALGAPVEGRAAARLETDLPTLIRLYAGRPADPSKYLLRGAQESDLVIYG